MPKSLSRAEVFTRQTDQGKGDPFALGWAAESTMAAALQAEIDDDLHTHRHVPAAEREQLQHATCQTALAATDHLRHVDTADVFFQILTDPSFDF